MGKMLLGLAAGLAVTAFTTPAAAEHQDFVGIPNAKGTVGTLGGSGDLGIWVNGGEWAHYNNQTFQSDSYNDWWHDRPDRAYPAWMRNNQNCQRQWYAGNMLRC